eukprot:CAMPEP_0174253460 /NCGR_PEP_ID=MMETSP0439-20130205/2820_1 /TAXON_ID=0 /ORGANISM="Stereomyxa ramosa, Strain Chinc5" /LENGTH=881 /DNA_ID=CAMNT_0015334497 /DNA_START=180 /DNA_END=2825 /DNA_ORIENTATION=-
MSLLRALRRSYKAQDLSPVEIGGFLRYFDIPSRANSVEQFVYTVVETDEESNEGERELWRARNLEPDVVFPMSHSLPPPTAQSAYHNLFEPPGHQPAPVKPAVMEKEKEKFSFPKLQIQGVRETQETQKAERFQQLMREISEIGPKRDWNAEYQAILKRPLLERGTELQKLSDEFVSAAKQIGETIIREFHLPLEEKSIKPLVYKGMAGGVKYKVENIFFKFAVDSNDMYPSDQYAMKVAGHELKGITAMVSCGMMLGLSFPLLALIDYRGYRLIATSALPISEQTIIYGSCDGGNEVHTHLGEMNHLMEKVGKILNLKGHWAGLHERKWLYGPTDIEGHRTKDGKLYVVDTARLWPPETPDRTLKGGFLFQLLRPEFVKNNPTPLSSDVFTLFGKHDAAVHNAEAEEATRMLFEVTIPEFALALETGLVSSLDELIEKLHRAGINIRHLGKVRAQVESVVVKRLILLEILARVLKNKLRAEMRKIQEKEELHFQLLVLQFFNTTFGFEGDTSELFWKSIKSEVEACFPSALNDLEKQEEFWLYDAIDSDALFLRIQQLTAVHFKDYSTPFRHGGLTLNDLEGIYVREKKMYAIPRIEADTLAELAIKKDKDEAIPMLHRALEKYLSVIQLKPDDTTVLQNMGTVFVLLAKLHYKRGDTEVVDTHFESAYEKFECCLSINPTNYKALMSWGNGLCEQAAIKEITEESDLDKGISSVANHLYSLANDKYRCGYSFSPKNRDIVFNWSNQLRKQANHNINTRQFSFAETLLNESLKNNMMIMELPRKKTDILILDNLINWGCGILSLSKLKFLQGCETEEILKLLEEGKLQFMKAAALLKRGGLMKNEPEKMKRYINILSYNLKCINSEQSKVSSLSDMDTSL